MFLILILEISNLETKLHILKYCIIVLAIIKLTLSGKL